MQAILLVTIIASLAFQNSIRKPCAKRTNGEGSYFFSLMTSLAALLFFIATSKNIEYIPQVLPYSLFDLIGGCTHIFDKGGRMRSALAYSADKFIFTDTSDAVRTRIS